MAMYKQGWILSPHQDGPHIRLLILVLSSTDLMWTTCLSCWSRSYLLLLSWICALKSLVSLEDHILHILLEVCMVSTWLHEGVCSASFFHPGLLSSSLHLNWHIISFCAYFVMINHQLLDLCPLGNSSAWCLISAKNAHL